MNREVTNNHSNSIDDCNSCPQNGNAVDTERKLPSEVLPSRVVELHFKGERCNYYYNFLSLDLKIFDKVIVEAERGTDLGIISSVGDPAYVKLQTRRSLCSELKNVLRLATEDDTTKYIANKIKEEESFQLCIDKILKYHLSMRLVDVEYQLDGGRITFYYTADHRIDFRELVKDLANVYHTRIEMRQIGVRDETKRVGGLAICGRQLCCTTWLLDFEKVSSQYATAQGLAFNPIKLSGHCGRLKCCLAFELENYKGETSGDCIINNTQGYVKVEELTMSREISNVTRGNNSGENNYHRKKNHRKK